MTESNPSHFHSHAQSSRRWMKLLAFSALVLFVTLNTPGLFPPKTPIDHDAHIRALEGDLETLRVEKEALINQLEMKNQEVTVAMESRAKKLEPPPLLQQNPSQKHVVSKGDTLTGISLKYYGTSKRWMEIYEANKERIPDKNNMKIGITLNIP